MEISTRAEGPSSPSATGPPKTGSSLDVSVEDMDSSPSLEVFRTKSTALYVDPGFCYFAAFLHAVIFAASSIFSAAITSTTSEVLIRSPICGWPRTDVMLNTLSLKSEDVDAINALYTIGQWTVERSRDYARTCYSGSDTLYNPCNVLVRSRLESTANDSDSCPFRDNACTRPAYTMDSGIIDSDLHLGINAPPGDRIGFRKKMSCAPVDATKYSSGFSDNTFPPVFPWEADSLPGAGFNFYNFGKQTVFGLERNFTFATSNFTSEMSKAYYTG